MNKKLQLRSDISDNTNKQLKSAYALDLDNEKMHSAAIPDGYAYMSKGDTMTNIMLYANCQLVLDKARKNGLLLLN